MNEFDQFDSIWFNLIIIFHCINLFDLIMGFWTTQINEFYQFHSISFNFINLFDLIMQFWTNQMNKFYQFYSILSIYLIWLCDFEPIKWMNLINLIQFDSIWLLILIVSIYLIVLWDFEPIKWTNFINFIQFYQFYQIYWFIDSFRGFTAN